MMVKILTTEGSDMSKEHLVEAYLRGDLSRRVFVRRLVAVGVSLTAALSYAEMSQVARADPGNGQAKGHANACANDFAKGHVEFYDRFCDSGA
jgi:hypothetical protein